MKVRLIICCIIFLTSPAIISLAEKPESTIYSPFLPGKEFFPFEKRRIKITPDDFDKPITDAQLYFHLVPSIGPGNFPILDTIVTLKRPCSEVKELLVPTELKEVKLDECSSKWVNAGQIVPNSSLWQIRDRDGRVVRQWEPAFIDWLRCDGDHHFGTSIWLPNDDLANSFLILYFKNIDGIESLDNVVFEIDIRHLKWPKIKSNF
ncbi:MAG: hypothetical protein KKB51_11830 [Candidatus Riflebacteria bacterium]|nr:hypothetical protein [Candidatus Riflebacteria bacterium]